MAFDKSQEMHIQLEANESILFKFDVSLRTIWS